MAKVSQEEVAFLQDLNSLASKGPRLQANLLLLSIIVFFVGAIYWFSIAELDSVTRGTGKVNPSSQVQIIQNLEGGILAEIYKKEGDKVNAGEDLLRIEDTILLSKLKQNRTEYHIINAEISRLSAEVNHSKLVFKKDTKKVAPAVIKREKTLYRARKRELASKIEILQQKFQQKKDELFEIENRLQPLKQSYDLAKEELDIMIPMFEKGVTSKVELLRLRRQLNELNLKIQSTKLLIPKAKSSVVEFKRRIQEEKENSRAKSLKNLNKANRKLDVLMDALPALNDRVVRTAVKSPVAGIIKRVWVNTIGGVIKPGMSLVEVVPMEKNLLIEAKIKPSDIAFIHPEQMARVKITAYDFAIYGALDAKLEHISADSIQDKKGNSYYIIRVRTSQNYLLGKEGQKLPIIPGMTAEVDIITGKTTILKYLLKPILRAWGKALREP
ncbi:MAG: HlyD family type I secretion periplasmic adaptor subunit [Methylococcales bacterium]|jgi:membrane fusion protein, adhesin transport system|nr:HlyD family type I secretion periplasmic adaptor subunit [Methylococcales bacterium]MBT7409920.1 HlyD family type I secretion periplasmic adaptor subunit [Methylococcales bacterium]